MPDTLVAPAYCWVPDRVSSYGPQAIDLAREAGRDLDPEQELVVDALLSTGSGGRPLTLESAVVKPRQNGKTGGELLPVVLNDLFLGEPDRIVWTAHLARTSRDAFVDICGRIEFSSWLSRRVKKIIYGHGEEVVELHSGARLEFLARSLGSGRGLGGKRLIMDEAMYLSAESMGALIPTLSARAEPQIIYASSAGVAQSDHLRRLRDRGRPGGDPSLIWVEWCASGGWDIPPCQLGVDCSHEPGTDGCALDDEALWLQANPAMGRRITVEYIRAERRALPPAEFGRERLGWFDLAVGESQPIGVETWVGCAIELIGPTRVPVFFLDCSPGLSSASISAALVFNEQPYVELADYRPGTEWLVGRAKELADRYREARFGVLSSGAVASLLPKLKEAGVEPQSFTVQQMGHACGHLQKLVTDKAMTHSGDPLYARALAGAVKRDIGDDLWTWSRRKSTDISPIVSATGALWLLETRPSYDVLQSAF